MKTITLSKYMLLVVLFFTSWSLFSQTYSGGAGTVDNPYRISNKSDLKYLSENDEEWGKHFIQTADLTFTTADFENGGVFYNDGLGFNPIGTDINNFTGSFNGQDFIISNLTIDRPLQDIVGMFGWLSDEVNLSNIHLEEVSFIGADAVGALVGANESGTISNCSATGSVSGSDGIGGLIGFNSGTIIDCRANCSISGSMYIGGLVAYNHEASITNSFASGVVTGIDEVGGLVGHNYDTPITNSHSSSNVTGDEYVGGFVGYNELSSIINSHAVGDVVSIEFEAGGFVGYDEDGTYKDCSALGDVTSDDDMAGGFVGWADYSSYENCFASGNVSSPYISGGFMGHGNNFNLSNCYARGDVSAGEYAGGLVGASELSQINNCYSTGLVSNSTDNGGLIGLMFTTTVNNSFYDEETSGQNDDDGRGTPLTTVNMQTQTSFTNSGWDFFGETTNGTENIWQMAGCSDGDYPILTWQIFSGGNGNELDPFLISSKNDLKKLSESSCYWDMHFEQTADITFEDIDFEIDGDFYNDGEGFIPIGNNITEFSGSFDGQKYTISNLTINRPDQHEVGMFGRNSSESNLTNIYLDGGSVIGDGGVGGLIGINNGVISKCYNTGAVSGTNGGGLVGVNDGAISNCYANSSVTGLGDYNIGQIGGLVGLNELNSSLLNSYAIGPVSGKYMSGGLVGYNDFASIIFSFYPEDGADNGFGKAISEEEFKDKNTFTNAGWDFVGETQNGEENIWHMSNCSYNGYPVFSWQEIISTDAPTGNLVQNFCEEATLADIEITGTEIIWYDAVSGGNVLDETEDLVNGNSYFATQVVDDCESDERLEIEININSFPETTISQADLTLTADQDNVSYQWLDCNDDNSPISGETNQSFTVTENGSYAVEVTLEGCSAISDCIVINDLSVDKLNGLPTITLYPNPNNGKFTVDFGSLSNVNLTIRDVTGKIVYNASNIMSNTYDVMLDNNKGVYLVEISSESTHQVLRVVKQ